MLLKTNFTESIPQKSDVLKIFLIYSYSYSDNILCYNFNSIYISF